MSYSDKLQCVTLIAGESLAGGIYSLVRINGAGKVVRTTSPAQTPVGVVAEAVDATTGAIDQPVPVAVLTGIVPVKAGAAITAGQRLVASTAIGGTVVGIEGDGSLPSDTTAVGVALTNAVQGDVFPMLAQLMTA